MTDGFDKIKVEFAPGCFDNFEGTQEELDEFIAEITRLAESGELTDNTIMVTEENIDEIPEDILEWLDGLLENDLKNFEVKRNSKLN